MASLDGSHDRWSPSDGLDPHQRQKLTAKVLETYRSSSKKFVLWLFRHGLDPSTADEWDDCLVEYKNIAHEGKGLSLAEFSELVASTEFVLPRLKGRLQWCRVVLAGYRIAHQTKHTTPMGEGPAVLFGCHFSARGHPRLGVGIMLQRDRGTRPNEMLQILPEHVLVPWDSYTDNHDRYIVINLGVKQGTKLKRPQSVVLREKESPFLFNKMLLLKLITPEGTPIFPYSLSSYRRILMEVEQSLGLPHLFTPHSPRAGFASENRARGWTFAELKDVGRWISDSSLRVYLDLVGASEIAASMRTMGLNSAMAYCLANLDLYF